LEKTVQDSEVSVTKKRVRFIIMETNQTEWRSADLLATDGPSLDFIRAVAELLETDPDDILAELGYEHAEPAALAVSEA
jgi:hypothetical protein